MQFNLEAAANTVHRKIRSNSGQHNSTVLSKRDANLLSDEPSMHGENHRGPASQKFNRHHASSRQTQHFRPKIAAHRKQINILQRSVMRVDPALPPTSQTPLLKPSSSELSTPLSPITASDSLLFQLYQAFGTDFTSIAQQLTLYANEGSAIIQSRWDALTVERRLAELLQMNSASLPSNPAPDLQDKENRLPSNDPSQSNDPSGLRKGIVQANYRLDSTIHPSKSIRPCGLTGNTPLFCPDVDRTTGGQPTTGRISLTCLPPPGATRATSVKEALQPATLPIGHEQADVSQSLCTSILGFSTPPHSQETAPDSAVELVSDTASLPITVPGGPVRKDGIIFAHDVDASEPPTEPLLDQTPTKALPLADQVSFNLITPLLPNRIGPRLDETGSGVGGDQPIDAGLQPKLIKADRFGQGLTSIPRKRLFGQPSSGRTFNIFQGPIALTKPGAHWSDAESLARDTAKATAWHRELANAAAGRGLNSDPTTSVSLGQSTPKVPPLGLYPPRSLATSSSLRYPPALKSFKYSLPWVKPVEEQGSMPPLDSLLVKPGSQPELSIRRVLQIGHDPKWRVSALGLSKTCRSTVKMAYQFIEKCQARQPQSKHQQLVGTSLSPRPDGHSVSPPIVPTEQMTVSVPDHKPVIDTSTTVAGPMSSLISTVSPPNSLDDLASQMIKWEGE